MNNINRLSRAARSELARALENGRFEIGQGGVLFPTAGLFVGGNWLSCVRRRGCEEFGEHAVDPNIVVNEGLSYALKAIFAGFTQISTWYVSPFIANTTPVAALTAATYPGSLEMNEFVNYDEATRPEWEQEAEDTQTIENDVTPAAFTISTGGGTVRGAALISSSAKSSDSGTLFSASKFSSDRVMSAGDILRLQYSISAQDV
jgi:hypothetical protein